MRYGDATLPSGRDGGSAAGGRLKSILKLAIAIAVVQAVFWLFVNPVVFSQARGKHTSFELSGYEAATLATPDTAGLAAAQFKPIEGPGWYDCCAPGYRAIRYQVDIPQVPEEGVGLLVQLSVDNFEVRVNGAVAVRRGRLTLPDNTYHGNEKRIEFIPASAFHAGKNQIDYITVRNAMPYFDLLNPIIGPAREIEAAFGYQAFLLGPFLDICVIAGFLLSAAALVLLLQSEAKGFAFGLLLLVLAWTLKTQFYSWSDPPFGGLSRLFYYFLVTALVPVAWLNFADQWTGKPIRWIGPLCVAAFALMAGSFAYVLWSMPGGEGFDLASEILNVEGAIFMALTFCRLGWHAVTVGTKETRDWEVAIFVLILLLAIIEFASEFFWQRATGHLTRTSPLLIAALAIAVFARSIRLFRSADQINQVLSQRLALREGELQTAHARERDFVRRQAHNDERQRILRDMHDGLGSQLMSMLLAARRGDARPDRVAEGLQAVVDEMRLMIASMDSVGESLFAALTLFRDRMTPKAEAAGFRLVWTNDYTGDFPNFGPRPTLHVFRILQEAVTNALKHSGGKTIAIAIQPGPDSPDSVRITIRDDGAGNAVSDGTGRGLANMRSRAAAIGARLDVAMDETGACVTLDLPPPGAASPSSPSDDDQPPPMAIAQ